jgi:hypothetical protein
VLEVAVAVQEVAEALAELVAVAENRNLIFLFFIFL